MFDSFKFGNPIELQTRRKAKRAEAAEQMRREKKDHSGSATAV